MEGLVDAAKLLRVMRGEGGVGSWMESSGC